MILCTLSLSCLTLHLDSFPCDARTGCHQNIYGQFSDAYVWSWTYARDQHIRLELLFSLELENSRKPASARQTEADFRLVREY